MAQTTLGRNRDFVAARSGPAALRRPAARSAPSRTRCSCSRSHTRRPRRALVSFARLLPSPLLGLLAGVAADRWDRRAHHARSPTRCAPLAIGALALVARDRSAVLGDRRCSRSPKEQAMRSSRPPSRRACARSCREAQLPAAIGVQQARVRRRRDRGAARRRRAVRRRARAPVRGRRGVVHLLVRLAARDAHAVPGAARDTPAPGSARSLRKASASSGTSRSCARRRSSTRSATSRSRRSSSCSSSPRGSDGLTGGAVGALLAAFSACCARRLARVGARRAGGRRARDHPRSSSTPASQ